MVKLLAGLMLLTASAGASVTVTVNASSLSGGTTPGAYVKVDLQNCQNPTILNSGSPVSSTQNFTLNSGQVTMTLPDNVSQIACNGNQFSYYSFTLVSAGVQTFIKSVELPAGGPFNLANLLALTDAPFNSGVVQGPVGVAGATGATGPAGAQGPVGVITATGGPGQFKLADQVTPNQNPSQNPTLTVNHTIANTNGIYYAHGYTDDSTFSNTGGDPSSAYAAYDVRTQLLGSGNIGHLIGFQSLPTTGTSFSGSVDSLYGFFSQPYITGGTVNTAAGYYVADAAGGAAITTQYGLYLKYLQRGATNWQIYSENGNSFLGGGVYMGLQKQFLVNGIGALSINTASTNTDYATDTPATFSSAGANGTFVHIINSGIGGKDYSWASSGPSGAVVPVGTMYLFDATASNVPMQFDRPTAPSGSTSFTGFAFSRDGLISYGNGSTWSRYPVAASITGGFVVLSGGTATVSTTAACAAGASCIYQFTNCGTGTSTAVGVLSLGTINAGSNFSIQSISPTNTLQTGDVSCVNWRIN